MTAIPGNLKFILPRRLWLARGESTVAAIGMSVTAILILALTGCGYWLLRTQTQAEHDARRGEVRGMAIVLGQALQEILADKEVSPARRLFVEATARHGLTLCQLTTVGGEVLIDGATGRGTNRFAETDFSTSTPPAPSFTVMDGVARLAEPVAIGDGGYALLKIEAPVDVSGADSFQAQLAVGAISAGSLLALLLVYRHFRTRMAALGVIREALLEAHRGQTSESALMVAADLGEEAAAWNHIVGEQQKLRRLAAVQEAKQGMGASTAGDSGDLAGGCDAMTQGLVMVDETLRVRYANHAAAMFLHSTREGLLNQPIDTMIPEKEVAQAVKSAIESAKRATHMVDRRATGGTGVLRFVVRPVRRGDASTAMLVIEDVTQQRVAEEARHDFVAHATHELRTPLTNIRLYLETLIDEGDKDAQLKAKCLNVMNQETRRLERMVGDMLSVAEIEAGAMKLQRDDVRVDELLQEVQRDYQPQADEKRILLEFKLPPKLPVIQADRDKLALAVQNVVGNALKYTPERGKVTVAVDVSHGSLTIDVVDTGIGISKEDAQKVFEKFYRAQDKRVASITGSGLGLALAREVMRLHGGDITLESQLDHGSTFSISVPLHADGG